MHIKPPVGHLGIFDFDALQELVELGEREAARALVSHEATRSICEPAARAEVEKEFGLQRGYAEIVVDASRCTRCGVCAAVCATDGFAARGDVLRKPEHDTCTRDGACVKNCPVDAIDIRWD